MAKIYDRIDGHLREWIAEREMFFVASAPLDAEGHVNVSPKGPAGTLRVLDDHTVAYLDMVGSGAETVAHVRENGRIVVMLCAFQGPPRILRLHGRGEVIPADDPRFAELFERAGFEAPHEVSEAQRALILVDVIRVADSCGYGVPLMAYESARPHSDLSTAKRLRVHGPNALRDYQAEHNLRSLDGLPAVELAE